ILDTATGKEIRSLHGSTDNITDVAFSPDGQRLVASCYDGTIKVWEVATGREAFTCLGHEEDVWNVAFSPDGTRFASAGSRDRKVRLWDARTGQAIGDPLPHPEAVWGIAFSPNGSQIVSGGFDKAVRLWEVTLGRLLRTFERSVA